MAAPGRSNGRRAPDKRLCHLDVRQGIISSKRIEATCLHYFYQSHFDFLWLDHRLDTPKQNCKRLMTTERLNAL
ncbi:hypothetical protein AVEN_179974-1 [Araneus ventricosus]|uniref:Uncharacterized protein n=1 Tax=Araneus ventricosus TaxID=182803 RepID=A0A4Y2T8X6_ARAVE|nr:hypothetical protein AVEN_179974-1 [Araneus ventricosus]